MRTKRELTSALGGCEDVEPIRARDSRLASQWTSESLLCQSSVTKDVHSQTGADTEYPTCNAAEFALISVTHNRVRNIDVNLEWINGAGL